MKIVVIGCTHAGTAAILNARKEFPDAEISVYEINDNISFLSCGIALYVGGVVKDPAGLFYSSPEQLKELNVNTYMQHEVLKVDTDAKSLDIKNLSNGETFSDIYDKLIVTTGSWPIVPPFEGLDLENILLCKNFNHSNKIIEKAKDAKKITVIGAGYIGVELVEAFEMAGKEVTVIDALPRIMSKYLDKEFTDVAEKSFADKGVTLALDQKVESFKGENGKVTTVVTDKASYETELVILCIGFRPNTELFKGQLDMLPNGAIKIDEYMRTSKKDVFAAGDSCAVIHNVTEKHAYLPLATNAIRMGTVAAKSLVEPSIKYCGTQATSGIKIYEHCISSTGFTEEVAKMNGFEIETATITDNYRPEFMPTNSKVTVKLVYDKNTKRILGAQAISDIDITQMINTVSVVIQNKMTVEELAMQDFFFQPHFNKPWNLLNAVALEALK